MRILLASGGFRTPERIAFLAAETRAHFGAVDRVLFFPYALKDHDRYVQALAEKGLDAGFHLDGIHRHADPQQAVREARAIYVGGGNTFRLLAELYRFHLLEPLRERVRAGIPYLGISAGSNIASPTIMTTNDMPIVMPPSLDALGLVPFQINPHYYNGEVLIKRGDELTAHFGETRDERLREFHEMNDAPVLGLWEGGAVRINGPEALVLGAPVRIIRKNQDPFDAPPGSRLDDLLKG